MTRFSICFSAFALAAVFALGSAAQRKQFAPQAVDLLSMSADEKQPLVVNGRWWVNQPETVRTAYIAGYVTAIKDLREMLTVRLDATRRFDQKVDEAEARSCYAYLQGHEAFTVKQYLSALDAFYGDVRNRQIDFMSAADYVRLQLMGMSKDVLHTILEGFRKEASQKGRQPN